jgi:hypothetical protein
MSLSLGATWNVNKGTGLPLLDIIMGHKGPSNGLGALGPKGYFSGCIIEVKLKYLFGCIIKTM